MILFLCSTLLFALYVALMLLYKLGWWRQSEFVAPSIPQLQTKISIIIAARNEAINISRTIESILVQDYPVHLYELIIVDDFSTDDTAAIVSSYPNENIRLIQLKDFVSAKEAVVSYKKKALALGIEKSKGALIVTTDADCWMGNKWLWSIAAFYETQVPEMIVAPVCFSTNNSLLQRFQLLDFTTMQGITTATVRLDLGIMCNGANLVFTRKAYDAVEGYKGVEHLVSGDDYLLQLKIKKVFPNGVKYLKSKAAIVYTEPQKSWHSFLQQRIRWGSKTGKYADSKMTIILSLIYLFNLSLVLLGLHCLFVNDYRFQFISLILGKIFIELFFLIPVANFYNQKKQLFIFPFLQPLHIAYIVLAGFLSRKTTFVWKERVNTATNTKH